MDAQEARRLRHEWFGKSCAHTHIEQETGTGVPSETCVCTTCGAEFAKRDMWEKLRVNIQRTMSQEYVYA